ncbi:MAG: iron-sulfur cluster assembly scaffold protein [Verrucomicrobia bacterium]|nr:iron-sulfur cluster assembly scaffold protein [Verrucomicrobiota bacterium]
MEVWIKLRAGRVEKATFDTDGCAATLACGSAVTLLAADLTVEQASHISQRAVLHYLGGLPEAFEHCALLAATTFQIALAAAHGDLQEHIKSSSGEQK